MKLSKDKAIKILSRYDNEHYTPATRQAHRMGAEALANAVEAVRGRWMEYTHFMTCSVCDTDWYYGDNECDRFDYCPNCGAKMDGDENARKDS